MSASETEAASSSLPSLGLEPGRTDRKGKIISARNLEIGGPEGIFVAE